MRTCQLNRNPGAHYRAIVTFARTVEGRRGPRYPGNAGSDRKRGIFVLMFPGRLEGWLENDRSNLPLVKHSESDVAAQRLDGVRMDRQGRERALLAKTVIARRYIEARRSGPRSDDQNENRNPARIKVLHSAPSVLPLASPASRSGRSIVVVAAINGPIEIKPMVCQVAYTPAAPAIDIDMTARIERGPGMRVLAHHPDRQLIGDPVIDARLTPPVVKL